VVEGTCKTLDPQSHDPLVWGVVNPKNIPVPNVVALGRTERKHIKDPKNLGTEAWPLRDAIKT